jgi:uncharacterized OB-fold protein
LPRRIPRRPTLFTAPEDPATPPALRCGRCDCGHVFFPPQQLGCERCGAHGDALEVVEVAARGVLQACAASHREPRADARGPRVLGTIVLDAGPALEADLDVSGPELPRPGQRVAGRLVEVERDDEGRSVVDCQFAPEAGAT